MSESILEQLALWHLAAICEVTVAGGYQQTLVPSRSEEKFLDGEAITDLSVLCALSGDDDAVVKVSETINRENPRTKWSQKFDAIVHILGDGGTGLAVDNRITRIVADVQKRLRMEYVAAAMGGRPCGGLAEAIELVPWQIGMSPTGYCTIVNVPVRIHYWVKTNDPYSQ
jgi:hypothetical protein